MAKFPSGSGATPKGGNNPNSGATRGGPGTGKDASGNNKSFKPTTPASGKAHPGYGAGGKEAYKNPKVKVYAQGPGKFSGGF